jgi:hypothetical protein
MIVSDIGEADCGEYCEAAGATPQALNAMLNFPKADLRMSKLNHYKAALYLCAAIVAIQAIWTLFVMFTRPQIVGGAFFFLALSFVILLGLLLQSNFIRYIGALYMIVFAVITYWLLFSEGNPPYAPVFLYFTLSGALNLLAAAILLFSKQFTKEFDERQNSQSKYKANLGWALNGAVIAAMIVASLLDFLNIANGPR